eukprot:TRINITY_DN10273_c0_g1_i1.p1 TRINITY_DN10273_c0_g1~~TRINITY_DN10273_c0_g1_i1.p1  ORF type:complete len:208 (-),score=48.48 TRINITY_DN10273_c0_g1_i1:52-675(-)
MDAAQREKENVLAKQNATMLQTIRDIQLLDSVTKAKLPASNLWSTHEVTILKLLRRFGCPLCRMGALQSWDLKAHFDQKYPGKVDIVGVGYELIGYEEFVKGDYFPGKVYFDETREIYRRVGLPKASFCEAAKCGIWKGYIKSRKKGIKGNFTVGDGWQYGGILVLTKKGQVLMIFRQKFLGDEPENEDLIKVIEQYLDQETISIQI